MIRRRLQTQIRSIWISGTMRFAERGPAVSRLLLIPLIVIFVPAFNDLPRIIRMRDRPRITRWYGKLALLERVIVIRQGEPPVQKWLQDLEKLSRSVGHARMPAIFASEVFTLLEHIDLVRREIEAKRASPVASESG